MEFKFAKLTPRHKKKFILNQFILIISLIAMFWIAMMVTEVKLPTNVSKMSAGLGFILGVIFLAMALLNRISVLFKLKSLGFIMFFLLFLLLRSVIDVTVWSLGLLSIPLLIDDIICKPIWNYIWDRDYDR